MIETIKLINFELEIDLKTKNIFKFYLPIDVKKILKFNIQTKNNYENIIELKITLICKMNETTMFESPLNKITENQKENMRVNFIEPICLGENHQIKKLQSDISYEISPCLNYILYSHLL